MVFLYFYCVLYFCHTTQASDAERIAVIYNTKARLVVYYYYKLMWLSELKYITHIHYSNIFFMTKELNDDLDQIISYQRNVRKIIKNLINYGSYIYFIRDGTILVTPKVYFENNQLLNLMIKLVSLKKIMKIRIKIT